MTTRASDTTAAEAAVPLIRVNGGPLDAEELAALTAVLRVLSLEPADTGAARPPAGWHRLERSAAYANPRSWHQPPRRPRAVSP